MSLVLAVAKVWPADRHDRIIVIPVAILAFLFKELFFDPSVRPQLFRAKCQTVERDE
jgi:hypothetical protein